MSEQLASSTRPIIRYVSKMSPPSILLATLLLLSTISHQAEASGVFELEFIKLQQLDNLKPNENSNNKTNLEQQMLSTRKNRNEDSTNLVRVLVCLKEAFTSQLDGPCTFGNASITLNRDSIQQPGPIATTSFSFSSATNELVPRNQHQDQSGKQGSTQQQGSLMTYIVRILFTFRWTKSFTIILTAEQLQINADNQQQQQLIQVREASQLVALRHGANNGSTNPIDSTIVNSSTREPQTTNQPHPSASIGLVVSKPQFIDRHVLTENEVLPNLEPNPNKPWASRFSRSLKSSLAYRFRVYCSLNYYGDGCTTFCRARDDQFGHYSCSSTGQKICIDGWQGPDCDKAKCRSGCNQQHGYCEKPDTCQCRPGWNGPRCDECITYPGCQNGYCLSPWQCICQRNWGGVLCDQDLNYCGTHEPCKNNGTCQNIAPGKYKCNCQDNFAGVDCDINLTLLPSVGSLTQINAGCALNPCLNGGTCYGFNSLPVDNGSSGTIDGGSDISGINHEVGERFYRCQCASGWTGDYCQWSDSASLSFTNLLLLPNSTIEKSSQTINTTDTISSDSVTVDNQKSETVDIKIPPYLTAFIESPQSPSSYVDMKHLISGVVIASVVGVFLASLLLAWCCLMAIERNRFSFIQMNIIRSSESEGGFGQPIVSSALRRVHEKIRDSFRRSSRNRIKPETKLSIENVLRPPKPPPTYEESSNYNVNNILIDYNSIDQKIERPKTTTTDDKIQKSVPTKEILVMRGAIEQKLASSLLSSTSGSSISQNFISSAQLSCPKHGHLYRQQSVNDQQEISSTGANNVTKPTTSVRLNQSYFYHDNHLNHH